MTKNAMQQHTLTITEGLDSTKNVKIQRELLDIEEIQELIADITKIKTLACKAQGGNKTTVVKVESL